MDGEHANNVMGNLITGTMIQGRYKEQNYIGVHAIQSLCYATHLWVDMHQLWRNKSLLKWVEAAG